MLCADESTFLNLKPIFNNWYYMLISLMSYSNPTFNISDLHLQLASNVLILIFFYILYIILLLILVLRLVINQNSILS